MLARFLIWSLLLLPASLGLADDFRIETKVYSGDEETPVSQNTTLFQKGVVYDFMESTGRVAIFRASRGDQPGRFVLLDPRNSIKTELPSDRIDAFIEKLRVWARNQRDPLLVFHANPTFAESFDSEEGILSLENPQMTYRVLTKSVSRKEVSSELKDYFDAYAKLNCMLGSPWPPMPRLELNKSLQKHQVFPVEVTLTIKGNQVTGEKDTVLRAEHTFTWLLNKADRDRITLADQQLVNYRDVDAEEFKQLKLAKK